MAVTYNLKGTSNNSFLVGNSTTQNTFDLSAQSTGNNATITSTGVDTDIGLNFISKGTGVGNVAFQFSGHSSSSNGILQLVSLASGPTNGIQISNSTTGNDVNIQAIDIGGTSDTDINVIISGSGNGTVTINNVEFSASASNVNNLTVSGSDTGLPVSLVASGADTDVDIDITPKANGIVTVASDFSFGPQNGATAILKLNNSSSPISSPTDASLLYAADVNSSSVLWQRKEDGTAAPLEMAGKQTIWIPASGMVARTTNGAASGETETTTNKVMISTYDFDPTTDEFAQFNVVMPKSYDGGTVFATFYWTAASGSGNVVWGIQGMSLANDDALDTAFGTAQTVTDTLIATNDMHITSETSGITVSGAASEEVVYFQVYRDADNGSDTFSADAQLLGVRIIYTTDKPNDD